MRGQESLNRGQSIRYIATSEEITHSICENFEKSDWILYDTRNNIEPNLKRKKLSLYKPGEALKGYRRLHLPEFIGNRNMNVVRLSTLRTGRLYPHRDGTHFCYRLSRPQGQSAAGMI